MTRNGTHQSPGKMNIPRNLEGLHAREQPNFLPRIPPAEAHQRLRRANVAHRRFGSNRVNGDWRIVVDEDSIS